jgi:dihydrofolate reductase
MAAFWPSVTDPGNRVASALNSLPKHVVTATLATLAWPGSAAISGDIARKVAELKQAPGRELQIHGSGALARSLMGQDLIDSYRLVVFPVVLGRGQRLFDGGLEPTTMRLAGTRTTGSGVVMHTYHAAGRPAFGSVTTQDA